MKVKFLLEEDFVNYKKPSMFIGFPTCTWKCEKECGKKMCQNSKLAHSPDIEIKYEDIVKRYMNNPISKAIVFGGLEPLDSYGDMINLIDCFREVTKDDIVIYTGYAEEELESTYFNAALVLEELADYSNIIVKFGRFIPNDTPHFDEVLGINLASNNQYAKRIC